MVNIVNRFNAHHINGAYILQKFHLLNILEDVNFTSEVIVVTVQPGQQTVDVVFELLDDELAEGNETFCLFLFIPDTASVKGVKGGATVCAEAVIIGRLMEFYNYCPVYTHIHKVLL